MPPDPARNPGILLYLPIPTSHRRCANRNSSSTILEKELYTGNLTAAYYEEKRVLKVINTINNGNRTEWSLIRSVIIRVINKIGRSHSGSPICLITSMITDRIGRHEVLLPINHNFNKICDIIGYFLNQNTRNSKFCFAISEKKSHLSMRVMARTVQLLRHHAYCFTKLSN